MWTMGSFVVFILGVISIAIWGWRLMQPAIDLWPRITRKEGTDILLGFLFFVVASTLFLGNNLLGIIFLSKESLIPPQLTGITFVWFCLVFLVELCCFDVFLSRYSYNRRAPWITKLMSTWFNLKS